MSEMLCHGAACREGWPILLTMQEYFVLQSLAGTQELRHRIDARMRLQENPTLECYAQLNPNHRGVCPLHCEGGSCGLKAALGETPEAHA